MKEDKNLLRTGCLLLQKAWIHRKGNEAYASTIDVIDTIWPKLKPLIIKHNKTANKHCFVVNLPPGISFNDFKNKEQYFTDATGGAVSIEKHGRAVLMEIFTEGLQPYYKFSLVDKNKMYLPIPIGYSAKGFISEDMSEYPNLLITGMPGGGKSNYLHTLIVSLLLNTTAQIAIIDFKQVEYNYLNKHCIVATKEDKVKAVLVSVNKQIDKRLQYLKNLEVVKAQESDLGFIVLVIDELAELQDEDCQKLLNRIVRIGRAAGVSVVCATQRPSSTMFKAWGDSKAMFAATLAFKMRDSVNSDMVLGNPRAAQIPQIKGRAIYQYGLTELEVQTMHLPVSEAKKLINQTPAREMFDVEQYAKKLLPR